LERFALMDFSEIVEASNSVQAEGYLALVEKTIDLLRGEEGVSENFTITGKLVNLKPVGEALVIGDLHGDLTSLSAIMEKSAFLKKMEANKHATLIFLGDYGDRGTQSPELYYSVLSLKLAFPKQVVLLRGNHEGPTDLMASPHDLPIHIQRKFKEKGVGVYQRIRELFDYFYNAVYVEERYLMVHGGLPTKIRILQEIAEADKLHPEKSFLEELLWNDPDEQVLGTFPSPRGAGYIFGKTVTAKILAKLNVKILIRGHEPARDGYKINHDGKILTLFSLKGPPYFNAFGAYLKLPLAEKFENANQLLPYIYKF
jgi:diadenosine tetraphosphatase ApaH/serine/threonine PP2A family protein phosphatase